MIEVIVFDLHGTLIGLNTNAPRNGMLEFFEKYSNRKFALATDDFRECAEKYLIDFGILNCFHRLYTDEDMIRRKGKKEKDFSKITNDFAISPHQLLFISDGGNDYDTAIAAGINFAHVPYYTIKEEDFSLLQIDVDKVKGYLKL